MIQMTLRQLRYFDALARHGHFGRAAESCSISQPALSMQIKEMEEVLGGVLLERSARQVTLTPKLIKEVVEGRLDTAIVALPVSEPSLTEVVCFSENFLLVRPGEDEGTPVPSHETLREMRLLLLEEGHCFRDQALSFCNMQSPPREVLDASSLSTLVQMVGAGIGVTLIPEMAVGVETRSATVSIARFKDPQPSRTIGMVWRKTSPLAGQLQQITEVVCLAADALRKQHKAGSAARKSS